MKVTALFHQLLAYYFQKKADHFIQSSSQIENTQRSVLKRILGNLKSTSRWSNLNSQKNYEQLATEVPLADYELYKKDILNQKESFKNILSLDVVRYEPTSGSTSARKWIPYSQDFINELNAAAGIWLGDTYKLYPEIKNGRHYWSLSWLPQELRGQVSSDDSDLFGFFEGLILKNTMLIPPNLAKTKTSEAAWWATLIYLASAQDLTLISVWSPTYLLKIIEDITNNLEEIALALSSGLWGSHESELLPLLGPPPQRKNIMFQPDQKDFFSKLWPQLILISAWGSSSSKEWFDQLKVHFPKVHFQEKGLWATEGVVTIPFQEKRVLCIENHFYEFKDLETQEIIPSWQTKLNKSYQPIIWNSSGLLRYQLQDRVRVVDFFNQIPCIEFQGRLNSVDMVGEKLDSQWVLELFHENPSWQAITLLGCHKPKPYYLLCVLGDKSVDIEAQLMKLHHYQLARELGQLNPARVIRLDNISDLWELVPSSGVMGQNKLEVLREVQQIRDIAAKHGTKQIE